MTKYKMFQKSRIHPLNIDMINETRKKDMTFMNSPIAFLRNKYEKTLNRKIRDKSNIVK
jgi:hypothetical protein